MTITGSDEIVVLTPPSAIWPLLEDSRRLPEWAPMVKSTTGLTESAGTTRTCQVEFEGRKDEVVERCIEATPNQRIRWVMEQGMLLKVFKSVVFGIALNPEGADTTRVAMEYEYQPRNFFFALVYRFLMARKMAAMRHGLLTNIKRITEQSQRR